jgi:hypothetical protein
MCQTFEGERNYLLAQEKRIRQKGFDAQKAGVLREANPERDHELPYYSDKRQWWLGWDTAADGRKLW